MHLSERSVLVLFLIVSAFLQTFGTTTFRPRTTITFHQGQNPLTETVFVNLQVRALMRDVKDPVRLAGRLQEEALRVLKYARSYLLEIQIPEHQLEEDYKMSIRDICKYQELWAESVEELNRLEAMFVARDKVNKEVCN